jgi:hypothetical protein
MAEFIDFSEAIARFKTEADLASLVVVVGDDTFRRVKIQDDRAMVFSRDSICRWQVGTYREPEIHPEVRLDNPAYYVRTVRIGFHGETIRFHAYWHSDKHGDVITAYGALDLPADLMAVHTADVEKSVIKKMLVHYHFQRELSGKSCYEFLTSGIMAGVQIYAKVDADSSLKSEIVITSTNSKLLCALPEELVEFFYKNGDRTICLTDCRLYFGGTEYRKIPDFYNQLLPKIDDAITLRSSFAKWGRAEVEFVISSV